MPRAVPPVESNKVLAQRSARFEAVRQLVESGEGFEKGTRSVIAGLDQPDRFKPGIHGVLASFIEADNTCARAIEAALGSHLQAVLVQDQAAAEAIIGRLTEKEARRRRRASRILRPTLRRHPDGIAAGRSHRMGAGSHQVGQTHLRSHRAPAGKGSNRS